MNEKLQGIKERQGCKIMMKVINYLNSKTNLVTKSNYEFECTYAWSTILVHIGMLALWTLGFSIVSMMLFGFVLMNLELISPELAFKIHAYFDIKTSGASPFAAVVFLDLCPIAIICLLNAERLNKFFNKVLTKFCKRIPKEQKDI